MEARWTDLMAEGGTPMGSAFRLALEMLEDGPTPTRGTVLVLVSDGFPTDDWETALGALRTSREGSRALRIAIGIGTDRTKDADDVLAGFVTREIGVLCADQLEELPDLFSRVTDLVTRTRHAHGMVGNLGRDREEAHWSR